MKAKTFYLIPSLIFWHLLESLIQNLMDWIKKIEKMEDKKFTMPCMVSSIYWHIFLETYQVHSIILLQILSEFKIINLDFKNSSLDLSEPKTQGCISIFLCFKQIAVICFWHLVYVIFNLCLFWLEVELCARMLGRSDSIMRVVTLREPDQRYWCCSKNCGKLTSQF